MVIGVWVKMFCLFITSLHCNMVLTYYCAAAFVSWRPAVEWTSILTAFGRHSEVDRKLNPRLCIFHPETCYNEHIITAFRLCFVGLFLKLNGTKSLMLGSQSNIIRWWWISPEFLICGQEFRGSWYTELLQEVEVYVGAKTKGPFQCLLWLFVFQN